MKKIIVLAMLAVSFAACRFEFDAGPRAITTVFVPVESITGVPVSGFPYVGLPLTATVEPEDATNKRIEWSITEDGGTFSALDGARLTANIEGTVTVTAVIRNGLAEGIDYTEDFDILIAIVSPFKVIDITGIPAYLPIGDFTYTLRGVVEPTNAAKNIVWSVSPLDNGGTGATVTPAGFLSAARKGTVTVRATIKDGLLEDGDYTKDFNIDITRGVIAAGYYKVNRSDNITYNAEPDTACYWVNGEYNELNNASAGGAALGMISRTSGIVEANGKLYIAGYYVSNSSSVQTTICYWVDGVEKTLPDSAGTNGTGPYSYYLTTQSYDIAAGGGYVYIFGCVENYPDRTYCYWKIDASDTATKVTLTMPGDAYAFSTSSSKILVKNDGNVVIGAGNISDLSSYYIYSSSTGNETVLNPVKIDATYLTDNFYSVRFDDIALVNNDVYLTGRGEVTYLGDVLPYYYRLGDSSYHVFRNLDGSLKFSGIINESVGVVEQNGVPLFYSKFRRYNSVYVGWCYWGMGGDLVDIPMLFDASRLDTIAVLADGDVYVAVNITNTSAESGYVVLREPSFPFRKVHPSGNYVIGDTRVTGLVVR